MIEKQIEELLEEEAAASDPDPCHKRKCTSNEHCCDGMVCVDTSNGGEVIDINPHLANPCLTVTGSCLPVFGKKSGENCYQDADCETGYVCVDDTCSEPMPGAGKFGEEEVEVLELVTVGVFRRGMSRELRLQHPAGPVLPADQEAQDAAQEALHLLH